MRKNTLVAAVALAGLALPPLARADDAPVETQIVDAMNKAFGAHPGFRANHAKGIVAEGSFQGAPGAAKLSKAVLFDGRPIPATVRFSDATGLPSIADGAPNANPHGMAIKFHLPDGSDTDMVINSLAFFPVATGEEFRDLLLAAVASPPDAPKPTKLDAFVAAHPSVPAALATIKTPASFATDTYFGVNAFVLVNEAGARQAVRYAMVPERAEHLSPEEAAKRPPDFLMDELRQRLAAGKIAFRLEAQLAAPGDPTNDATKPWPGDRPRAVLGTLTVEKLVPDSAAAEKALLFLPGQLTDGIEPSDDPLIEVRNGAYAESFARRQ